MLSNFIKTFDSDGSYIKEIKVAKYIVSHSNESTKEKRRR